MYHPLFGEMRHSTEEEQMAYQEMLDKLGTPLFSIDDFQKQIDNLCAGMQSVGIKAEDAAQSILNSKLKLSQKDYDWIKEITGEVYE